MLYSLICSRILSILIFFEVYIDGIFVAGNNEHNMENRRNVAYRHTADFPGHKKTNGAHPAGPYGVSGAIILSICLSAAL